MVNGGSRGNGGGGWRVCPWVVGLWLGLGGLAFNRGALVLGACALRVARYPLGVSSCWGVLLAWPVRALLPALVAPLPVWAMVYPSPIGEGGAFYICYPPLPSVGNFWVELVVGGFVGYCEGIRGDDYKIKNGG